MKQAFVQGASRGLGLAMTQTLLRRGDFARVFATARDPERSEGLAALAREFGEALVLLPLDVCDDKSIASAAERTAAATDRLHLVINAAGVLHDESLGLQPEKRLEHVRPESLRRAFEVNAIGPLLVARHFLPLLRHDERSVLANVSARVGSIEDDRLGGWYAYRGSKAAQNLFTRNLSIELKRRAPRCICVALHPGTVDTALSRPFQGSVPPGQLFDARDAAARLIDLLESLGPEDTGSFLAYDGSSIPW
jgi:NAD(P)-dependent dehydrogenase (short-subunit alcohol dehydrogenase family)